MIKKTVSYTDYNGVDRVEDFYFNFTKAEITEMELMEEGGLTARIEAIVAAKDNKEIVKMFKRLVLDSYGEKSADGKRFIKNEEVKEAFSQTEAFSEIFMGLAMDEKEAAEFVNGIIPKHL